MQAWWREFFKNVINLTVYNKTFWIIFLQTQYWNNDTYLQELTSTALGQCIAVITELAAVAALALAVVQAFETSARSGVTGLRVHHVDVVVALTGPAFSAHLVWVSIITRGAFFTPGTCGWRDTTQEVCSITAHTATKWHITRQNITIFFHIFYTIVH